MNFNRKARILAEKIAKKRNLKIVEIWNGFNLARSLKSKLFVSPQKFIDLFKNADFVVTTSFHGTAFSIIYRKNFYYIGKDKTNENRVKNTLDLLSLSDRYLSEKEIESLLPDNINWGERKVTSILEDLRKSSIYFIKRSLNEV